MQAEEQAYIEDSDEEEPWPRQPTYASKETPKARYPFHRDGARRTKPAPAKYVIKREPDSQPAAVGASSILKHLLAVPKKREREMEAIEESDSQEDLLDGHMGVGSARSVVGTDAAMQPPSPAALGGPKGGVLAGHSRTVFGNYGGAAYAEEGGERGGGAECSPVPGKPTSFAGVMKMNMAKVGGFATPESGRLLTAGGAEGTPVSAQRKFLASHLPTASIVPVPSSARRVTPKKGMGPLTSQLHHLLQDQEKFAAGGESLTFQVLTTSMDGSALRAACRPDPGQGGNGRLGEVTLFLKTDPRLEVSPGDRICIRQPWQAMEVDGARVLLVRNAFVIGVGGFS